MPIISAPNSPVTSPRPQTAPTPGASTSLLFQARALDDGFQLRNKVEKQLEHTVQQLYEMEITAGYVMEGREGFMEKAVEDLVKSYEQLSELASGMKDTVPAQTLVQIDDGRNPHEYTRSTLNSALTASQWTNGKLLGYESYRSLLASAIATTFPEMKDVLPPEALIEVAPSIGAEAIETKSAVGGERIAGEVGTGTEDVEGNGTGGGSGLVGEVQGQEMKREYGDGDRDVEMR